MATKIAAPLPERRYLSREEAARWLGLSVETFDRLAIPYCDFGPRSRRWDVFDIAAYANENKRCDSARTSAPDTQRRRHECDSTNETARQHGGSIGGTRTVEGTARALGLRIKP
jgi:hypothetical protein